MKNYLHKYLNFIIYGNNDYAAFLAAAVPVLLLSVIGCMLLMWLLHLLNII